MHTENFESSNFQGFWFLLNFKILSLSFRQKSDTASGIDTASLLSQFSN